MTLINSFLLNTIYQNFLIRSS